MSAQGAGAAGDFGSELASAVVSAVREQERSTADRQVAAALALGWYLAALAHPGKVTESAAAVRGATTGLGTLSEGQMLAYCQDHVKVAFAKLRDVVDKAASLPDEELKTLGDCIESAEHEATRREAAEAVDAKALSALSAADFRLGKAYGIGAALMNLTSRPPDQRNLKAHLTDARIAPIVAAIDDLTSALPAHAGHGVRIRCASGRSRSWTTARWHRTSSRPGFSLPAKASYGGPSWRARSRAATCSRSTTTSMPPTASRSECARWRSAS